MPGLSIFNAASIEFLSNPTWDVILVLALLAGGFFYGVSAGKPRIAATIIYTYAAWAVFSAVPFEKILGGAGFNEVFFTKAGTFLVVFLLLAYFLGSHRSRGMAPAASWWKIFLLSFLQVGLLVHLVLTILPRELGRELAPITREIFANSDFHIWWILIPIATVILLRRLETE